MATQYGLTVNGWVPKPFAVIKSELEADAQALFGSAVDLSETSRMGNHVNNQALKFTQLWELAGAVHASFNPDTATGVSLAGIAGLVGIKPLGATKTVIPAVLYGSSGTPIPVGHQASFPNATLFLLSAGITISAANFADIIISLPSDPVAAQVFTVTINSIPYTYTAVSLDTKLIVVTALITAINAGSLAITASLIGSTLRVVSDDGTTAFSVALTATLQFDKIGSPGVYVADVAGKVEAPIGSLTAITQNVPGLTQITNLTAGTAGRNVETSNELRVRRRGALSTLGWSTDPAIQARLLQEVANVSYCKVYSNRTDSVDADGRDAHSLEVVIQGGTDADVAQRLWLLSPSGIAFYGATSVLITDSNGDPQTVKFSRPTPKYAWAQIVLTKSTEEAFPTNGVDLVKSAIVNWANENQKVSIDILIDKLNIPIYSVPGIKSATRAIAATSSLTPPGSYVTVNIPIGIREIAEFDVSRLDVTAV